jgi:hypothetical protein
LLISQPDRIVTRDSCIATCFASTAASTSLS